MSSQITVKRNLIIFHSPTEWDKIYQQIVLVYGIRMSVSYVIKKELGFTVRRHKGLVPPNNYYKDQVHLDFYSEAAQSWFQLKYLNI